MCNVWTLQPNQWKGATSVALYQNSVNAAVALLEWRSPHSGSYAVVAGKVAKAI